MADSLLGARLKLQCCGALQILLIQRSGSVKIYRTVILVGPGHTEALDIPNSRYLRVQRSYRSTHITVDTLRDISDGFSRARGPFWTLTTARNTKGLEPDAMLSITNAIVAYRYCDSRSIANVDWLPRHWLQLHFRAYDVKRERPLERARGNEREGRNECRRSRDLMYKN